MPEANPALDIIAITLVVMCVGIGTYWSAVLLYVRLAQRSLRPLREFASTAPPAGRVSVIMPAHNEQRVIDLGLTTLRNSTHPDLEIIVAADRCTDQTVEIVKRHAAEDARVRLVQIASCPDDWSGKCHACWQGAQVATGDWLIFTDADTLFDPSLVTASIALLEDQQLDFLSLLGDLSAEHGFERTTQPVAAMQLMKMFPIHRANRPDNDKRRAFANGQFMLFRRETYQRFGGHEAVKDAILEDLRFALKLNRQGYRLGLTFGQGLFHVRMYDHEHAFRRGWKRIFIEAANRNAARLQRIAIQVVALAFAPAVILGALAVGVLLAATERDVVLLAVAVASAIIQGLGLRAVYAVQGARIRSIVRFPLGCMHTASILREAAADLVHQRGIEWANLTYDVQGVEET